MPRLVASVSVVASVVSLGVLAGCDLDFDFDLSGPEIKLVSDSGRLSIRGCSSAGLLGCDDGSSPAGAMQAYVDGRWQVVPPYMPGGLSLFPDRSFELVVPSPEDPAVWVTLNGVSLRAEELPWFDLEVPAAAQRGQGSVGIVFQQYPKARIHVELMSRCGARQLVELFDPEVKGGRFELPLTNPNLTGTCTHEVSLTQTIQEPNDSAISLRIARLERAPLTSSD
ncbi:MAG: hypothetical protein IPQ07_11725 [Myxococcales bacterium]|nr:hypothetical protein [Myxococcales bacterium]